MFMSVDENDVIFICQQDRRSVLLLDGGLSGTKELISSTEQCAFYGMCCVQEKNMLIVGLGTEPRSFSVYSLRSAE